MNEMIYDCMHITDGVLTCYKDSTEELCIPPFVTSIAPGAFQPYALDDDSRKKDVRIDKLIIGKNVKSIGENAFYKARIGKIEVSEDNPYFVVENGILYNKEHTKIFLVSSILPEEVIIENGVEDIPDYAFYYTEEVKSLTIPSSVKSIGNNAFYSCLNLDSVHIGKGVSSIKEDSFDFNSSLSCITIDPLNTSYKLVNGVLYDKNLTSIVFVSKNTIEGSIRIPDTVTRIPPFAFLGCSHLENIVVGKCVKEIGNNAFCGCDSLTGVIIRDGVITISEDAFMNCKKLETVELGNSVKKIGNFAFCNCSLSSIYLSDSLETVGDYAFENCKNLQHVTLNNSSIKFGKGCFTSCEKLETVKLLKDYKTLSSWPFNDCYECKSITVSTDNPYLQNDKDEEGCIYNKEGTELLKLSPAIKDGYTIPSEVVKIADNAIVNCKNLTSIHISKNISFIGENNFNGCSSLQTITVDKDNSYFASTEDGCLYDKNVTKLIKYPGGKEEQIINNLPESLSIINSYAFSSVQNVEQIILPNYVKRIEELAFDFCPSLEDIKLNEGLEYIGKDAFYNCKRLKEISVPDSLLENKDKDKDSFKQLVYQGLNNFTYDKNEFVIYKGIAESYRKEECNIVIPEGVHTLGENLFKFSLKTNSIESIFIPKTVKEIENIENFFVDSKLESLETINVDIDNPYFSSIDGVLYNKDQTRLIYVPTKSKEFSSLPSSLKVIGTNAFTGCRHIINLTLPENLEVIEDYGFYDCENLQHIELNKGLKKIGKHSFLSCCKLDFLDISDSVEEIDNPNALINGKNSFTYNKDDFVIYDGVLQWYKGKSENVVIPEGVHTIGLNAFTPIVANRWFDHYDSYDDFCDYGSDSYDNIEIKEEYKKENYPKIKSIYIPSSVEKIESIEEVDSIEKIEVSKDNQSFSSFENVLYNKDFTEILYISSSLTGNLNIKEGVKFITAIPNTLAELDITSIHIPSTVEYIDPLFFNGTNLLESITVDKDNKNYSSVDGILYDKKEEELIKCPLYIKGCIKIPYTAKKFPNWTFYGYRDDTTVEFLNKEMIIEDRLFDNDYYGGSYKMLASSVYPSQLSEDIKRNIVSSVVPHLYEEDKKGSRYQNLWLTYIKEERKSLYNEIVSSNALLNVLVKEKFLDLEDVKALIQLNKEKQVIDISSLLLEYEHSNFTEDEITNFTMNDINKNL